MRNNNSILWVNCVLREHNQKHQHRHGLFNNIPYRYNESNYILHQYCAAFLIKMTTLIGFLRLETSSYMIKDYLTVHYPVTALVAGEVQLQNGFILKYWVKGQQEESGLKATHVQLGIHCRYDLNKNMSNTFFPVQVIVAAIHWFEHKVLYWANITNTSYCLALLLETTIEIINYTNEKHEIFSHLGFSVATSLKMMTSVFKWITTRWH